MDRIGPDPELFHVNFGSGHGWVTCAKVGSGWVGC